MATFIPGVTDYIPQIQPFKPDYNFLSGILQSKQNSYDAGRKKISEAYGTLLNAPLTKDENVKRRDEFFKMIDQDIKKISGMDLSLAQNQQAALNVFKPLTEDKYLLKDMAWTKNFQNQAELAERLKYCSDPEKCGGVSYSDEGVEYLGYQRERFKRSSMDESLGFENPTYAGDPGLQKKALKFAKDMGYDLKTVEWSPDGFYKIERTNDLTGSKGITYLTNLSQAFMGVFGNDGQVKDFYNQKAAVMRERMIRQEAPKFNNDLNAAEDYYNQNVLQLQKKAIERKKIESDELVNDSKNKINLIQQKVKKDGTVPGGILDNIYLDAQGNMKIANDNQKVITELHNEFVNSPNLKEDRKNLSKVVDRINATMLLDMDLKNVAIQHASLNYEEKQEVNPYGLALYNHKLDMSRLNQSFQNDMVKLQLQQEHSLKLEQYKHDLKLGVGNGLATSFTPLNIPAGSTAEINTYRDISQGIKESHGISSFYEKNITDQFVSTMINVINSNTSSDAEKEAAKKELKAVISDYNPKENKFVDSNGNEVEATITNYTKTSSWSNPAGIVKEIGRRIQTDDYKEFYGDLVTNVQPYIKIHGNEIQKRYELHKIHHENNYMVKGVMESSLKGLDDDEKVLLTNAFFQPDPSRGEKAYSKLSLENFKSAAKKLDPYKTEKELTDLYKVFDTEYRKQYVTGSIEQGGVKVPLVKNPYYSARGFNTSAQPLMKPWDVAQVAAGTGIHDIHSVLTDVVSNPQAKVYQNVTDIDGKTLSKAVPLTEKEASQILNKYLKDIKNPIYKSGDKRPSGTFIYYGVVGNDPTLEGYHIIPSKEYVQNKDVKGEELAEPTLIVLPKNAARSEFSKKFRITDTEIQLNTKGSIVIDEYPDAGKVSIRKSSDDLLIIEGTVIDYNTGVRREQKINVPTYIDKDKGLSTESIYYNTLAAMKMYQEANKQNINNINQNKKVYDFSHLQNGLTSR